MKNPARLLLMLPLIQLTGCYVEVSEVGTTHSHLQPIELTTQKGKELLPSLLAYQQLVLIARDLSQDPDQTMSDNKDQKQVNHSYAAISGISEALLQQNLPFNQHCPDHRFDSDLTGVVETERDTNQGSLSLRITQPFCDVAFNSDLEIDMESTTDVEWFDDGFGVSNYFFDAQQTADILLMGDGLYISTQWSELSLALLNGHQPSINMDVRIQLESDYEQGSITISTREPVIYGEFSDRPFAGSLAVRSQGQELEYEFDSMGYEIYLNGYYKGYFSWLTL